MQPEPPLPFEEALRILRRLTPLTEQNRIVVIGGQAVAFWTRELGRRGYVGKTLAKPLTSKDLDLRGTPQTVERSATLLGGEALLPRLGDMTPNTGVVKFVDSKGIERHLDFVEVPYGLGSSRDVIDTSIRVIFGDGGDAVPVRLMHPERCMESRIHNVIGLRTTHDLALRQADASIKCAAGFSQLILDDTSIGPRVSAKAVLKLNERIFRFASRNRSARRAFARHELDTFDAVVVDDRLPSKFRERRYPQMREQLAELNERRKAGWTA